MWGETDWWKGIQSKNGANALIGLGTGLLQGNTFAKGLAAGGQGFMQGAQLDDQYAAEADRKAKEDEMRARYSETLAGWGGEYADLAEGVAAGGLDPAQAYMTAWERRYTPKAAPDPFTLGEGQIRYDGSGNVIAQGLPSSPENVFNLGDNSGAFTKKGDELAATRLNTIIEGGNGAGQMLGDLQTLSAIGSQINTGKTAEIMTTLGPYAQAMGINIEGLGEAQAYKAIIDRMAPQMRPAGAGSSSDTDVRMFLNSLPSIGNTPQGNQIITQTFTALQQHKIAAAEIASKAFDGRLSWQEAEAEIRKLPNPYQGFNEYRKSIGGGASTQMPAGVTIREIP